MLVAKAKVSAARAALAASLAASLAAIGFAAHAAETIVYTYDAKGRLVKVERSGTVNQSVKTEYRHDRADNRVEKTITGSPNPPQP